MMPWFGPFSGLVWMDNADEEIQPECIMFMFSCYTYVFAVILNSNMRILYEDQYEDWNQYFSFFLLLQTILGILGICGNIVAGFILSRREMQNAFNLLLVILACFDSTYVSTMSFRATKKIYKGSALKFLQI